MNIMWIAISLAVVAGLAKHFLRPRQRDWRSGLGSVSERWLAEHRLTIDAQR